MFTDIGRLARRGVHTRPTIAAVPATAPFAASDCQQWLIRADSKLLTNLNALSVSINHATPTIRASFINNAIVDPRSHIIIDIENPLSNILNEIGDNPSQINRDFELPAITNVNGDDTIEAKQNGRTTIAIRKRKMRKHRLKKLRKRMKFEWAKKKQRKLKKREKEFQASIVGRIKEAEKFNAEDYVTEKLNKSKPLDIESLKYRQ